MKCPVCKTEITESTTICPNCKFDDLQHDFLNISDASEWYERKVIPYKQLFNHRKTDFDQIYNSLISEQFSVKHSRNENDFIFSVNEQGAILKKYTGTKQSVSVPAQYSGVPVYKIADEVFAYRKEIKEISLPSSVLVIGEKAFCGSSIEAITLPNNIISIGNDALEETNIKQIIFPESLRKISEHTCKSCKQLTSVIIMGAEIVGAGAFSFCDKLSRIAIASNTQRIEMSSFNSGKLVNPCPELIIPNSVKYLYCDNLGIAKRIAVINDNIEIDGYWKSYYGAKPTIFSNPGSEAQKFAARNGFVWMSLDKFRG